eukprot:s1965_g16.t1
MWRDVQSSSTTIYPLPAPHPGCFCRSGLKLNRRKLEVLARKRLLHVVVFCLNYFYLGRYPTLAELERRPDANQLECLQRLRSLLVVCGADGGDYPIVPGRSGPELGAALFQAEKFLERNNELSQSYVQQPVRKFVEDGSLFPEEDFPQLRPYRSLDVARLKLVGEGKWPMEEFLTGPFWLPYQEPKFLLHGGEDDFSVWPSFKCEKREENLKLAFLWSQKGLLHLEEEPCEEQHFCKVFNAFKGPLIDRQIGDRRIPNSRERSIDGPSHFLPPGFVLTNLRVRPYVEKILGSVTDRRDFYHQSAVTKERAACNMLPFSYPLDSFSSTAAFESFLEDKKARKCRKRREDIGDGFEKKAPLQKTQQGSKVFPCFASLFQGDHLGVEFALSAHEEVLRRGGLLRPERRLQGHSLFPSSRQYEGLIIDDYFALGVEELHVPLLNSFAARALAKAREIYDAEELLGSVEKDIEASDNFKAAGAEIRADLAAVRRGVASLALSVLSLRCARLPALSSRVLSRLAGNWVSVLMYKRCLSSAVNGLFSLAAEAERDRQNQLWPLPKAVTEAVWLGSDKKGCYTRLDSANLSLLAAAGEEVHEIGEDNKNPFEEIPPGRGPLLYFDFVEFYGGSGRVSSCLSDRGFSVAPPLDLSASRHYDMTDHRLLEWCMYMIESGRFASFLSEPPCTSFSPAAHPMVRSYSQPKGFDLTEEKTFLGNLLANRSFLLLRHGRRHKRPCGKEQPRLSKMAWLPAWSSLLAEGFEEFVCASCQFGSRHKKEFRFISYLLEAERLGVKCPGGHEHVRIEGAWTKPSAVYTWDLADHLAAGFEKRAL